MAQASGPGADALGINSRPERSNEQHGEHEQDLEASENTPLISSPTNARGGHVRRTSSAASLLRSLQGKRKSGRRWPSLIALVFLCILVILIMVLGFLAPETIEEYAQEAAIFEPTRLSIENITSTGIEARVQGDFTMDSSRVAKSSVRNLGRFGTWFASKVETGATTVHVSLPEYGNIDLGTADIPRIVVDVKNGHTTHVDFVADVTPGDFEGIRKLARDWIDGRLGQLRVQGKASIPLKSGIFNFGEQLVSHSITFNQGDAPAIPKYSIEKTGAHDIDLPDGSKGVEADAIVSIQNDHRIDFELPPLGFEVMVESCSPEEPRIPLAYVSSAPVHVVSKENATVKLLALVKDLPPALIQTCPDRTESPMDGLLRAYMDGKDVTVYVRGASDPSPDVPKWIADIMADVVIPISVPGHALGQLIEKFSLADVHFGLPNPWADEGSPDSKPTISAVIEALITLPEQVGFNVSVQRVRANADVFYKGDKMGELDLNKWQQANSTRIESKHEKQPRLLVQSKIEDAPLNVTDSGVFADVVQELMFGEKGVVLTIKANVDVQVETAIGELTVRRIPAEGRIPVKPIGKGRDVKALKPQVGDLQIVDTSATSLTISAVVNFTNPTEYSANIPFADVQILCNDTVLGHGTVQSIQIRPGKNHNIPVTAVWDPMTSGGKHGREVGVELLSQYLSGQNTTITLRTHEGSIPSQPELGKALSQFSIDIPTPRLFDRPDHGSDPEDPDKGKKPESGGPKFISDATMHLFSSSATFTLHSPLRSSTIFITYINATALYKGDRVGHIDYDEEFEVPPQTPTTSPPLPVDWSFGSVGYDAIKNAVGGSLVLAARATVGVKIGLWEERIWYMGRGIGAKIRI